MSDPCTAPLGESPAMRAYYLQQVQHLFASRWDAHLDPQCHAQAGEVRRRFAELGEYLADALPQTPELWNAVLQLHVALLLAESAVTAAWQPAHIPTAAVRGPRLHIPEKRSER